MKSSSLKKGDVLNLQLKHGQIVEYDVYDETQKAVQLAYLDKFDFYRIWCPRRALVKLVESKDRGIVKAEFAEWARENSALVAWVKDSIPRACA